MVEVGTAGLIAMEPSETWTGGVKRVAYRWKGNHADCKTEAITQAALLYDVSVEPIEGTPKSILTVITPEVSGGDPEDVVYPYWELTTSTESQDTWKHPIVLAWMSGMTAAEKLDFVYEINNAIENKEQPTSYAGFSADMKSWFLDRASGDDSYLVPRKTLRLTRIVPSYSSVVIDYSDEVQLITTTNLLSHALVTAYPLPSTIGTLPAGDWLIHPPEQLQSQDRQEIAIIYTLLYKETGGWGDWQYDFTT